jgi:type II secretory pathway pseudopilin PulG
VKNKSRSGYTVLELMLAAALMSGLLLVLGEAMRQSQTVFRTTSGTADASTELRAVTQRLRRELLQTKLSEVRTAVTPATYSGAPDGMALWFLSNLDDSGVPRFTTGGAPFWHRNVIYYIRVPQNHAQLFGHECGPGAGPDGYNDRCPHKVIIRKEVDSGTATSYPDEATVEPILDAGAVTSSYLTRPNKYDVSAMNAEPGVVQVQVVGRLFLTFTAERTSSEVNADLRAVSLPRARKEASIGTTPLFDKPFTYHFGVSVYPQAR